MTVFPQADETGVLGRSYQANQKLSSKIKKGRKWPKIGEYFSPIPRATIDAYFESLLLSK